MSWNKNFSFALLGSGFGRLQIKLTKDRLAREMIDFIYLFLAALGLECGLSLVEVRGGGATLHCFGFSCCRAWALGPWASVVMARRLSSCGARA